MAVDMRPSLFVLGVVSVPQKTMPSLNVCSSPTSVSVPFRLPALTTLGVIAPSLVLPPGSNVARPRFYTHHPVTRYSSARESTLQAIVGIALGLSGSSARDRASPSLTKPHVQLRPARLVGTPLRLPAGKKDDAPE